MPDGGRIHFASAMTQLGRNDGDDATTGASYLEFVAFLRQRGSRTAADLAQLWRRIVFFVCVSNTDDHLRNHGFLLDPGAGWRLAPAFDMNPVPEGDGLRLNIDEHDNAQELALVRSVSEVFGIGKAERDRVIDDVVAAVRRWRAVAAELGIPRQEQDRMAPAFRVADLTATG
jgi:serine/threonine-protein kinase HipA